MIQLFKLLLLKCKLIVKGKENLLSSYITKAVTIWATFFIKLKEPSLTKVYKIHIKYSKWNLEEEKTFPPKTASESHFFCLFVKSKNEHQNF